MGLGKTPQLVGALDRAGARRALILAPAIVCEDWVRAIARFGRNRPPATILDADPATLAGAPGDVVVSYDRAVATKEALRARRWDALVCDEAHYLKTPASSRTKTTLNPVYRGRNSLAGAAGALWLASGTPMPNHPAELWPALRAAGRYDGRWSDFVAQHCEVRETYVAGRRVQRIVGARDADAIGALLDGYMIRRLTADVMPELPPVSTDTLTIPGGEITGADPILPVLRRLDADAADAIDLAIAAGDWRMEHVPHLSTIRRLTGLAKAATVAEIARLELETGADKLVLFGLHSDVLQYLRHALSDYGPVMLTGAETPRQRRRAIDRFQDVADCRVAIGQIRAAGAGITLTAAARLLIVEPSWSPAENEQAAKRVHRIGQHRPCRVSYVALASSSDECVTAAVRAKAATARAVLRGVTAATQPVPALA